MKKNKINNVSLTSLVNGAYSSSGKENFSVNDVHLIYENALSKLSDSVDIMGGAPCFSYVKYISKINALPSSSAKYAVSDYSIPLLQMVLCGAKSYSCTPVNQYTDLNKAILDIIHFASSPSFSITYSDYDKYQYSSLDWLTSAKYSDLEIDFVWNKVKDVLGDISGSTVDMYRIISDDVREITYSNGVKITVNYGENEYNGIPSMGYREERI